MSREVDLSKVIKNINSLCESIPKSSINIMEVCGTHTNAIAKLGLKELLHKKINLISGPGCPVCVTPENYIDAAIELSRRGVIILTFGDLMRVKGENSNLLLEKSKGRDVRIIYSVYDVIKISEENKDREVVFLGAGFETTTPLIAAVIKSSKDKQLRNISFLISLKTMPPIIEKILEDKANIQGIICQGNVAVITGDSSFRFIYDNYKIPSVICGFEDKDIISGIYVLIKRIKANIELKYGNGFENLYVRYAKSEGNKKAKELIREIFKINYSVWRGIGLIDKSGLEIKIEHSELDAIKKFKLQKFFDYKKIEYPLKGGCLCDQIILGKASPDTCKLFGKECTPRAPYGPCMISSEGACAAYYRYR